MRIKRATQQRLAHEAELAGTSMVELLDAAADLIEERRLLDAMDRAYRENGGALRTEAAAWDATLADGLEHED